MFYTIQAAEVWLRSIFMKL